MGNINAYYFQDSSSERMVVVLGVRHILSPQKLSDGGQETDHTIFFRPGHNDETPNKLVSDNKQAQIEVKRNFVQKQTFWKEKQTQPKRNKGNMEQKNYSGKKFPHINSLLIS